MIYNGLSHRAIASLLKSPFAVAGSECNNNKKNKGEKQMNDSYGIDEGRIH